MVWAVCSRQRAPLEAQESRRCRETFLFLTWGGESCLLRVASLLPAFINQNGLS